MALQLGSVFLRAQRTICDPLKSHRQLVEMALSCDAQIYNLQIINKTVPTGRFEEHYPLKQLVVFGGHTR